MNLEPGTWVRTASGDVGQIVLISKLSAFVQVDGGIEPENVRMFLLSELTRVDPPQAPSGPTALHRPLDPLEEFDAGVQD